jgi:hypothetical protein
MPNAFDQFDQAATQTPASQSNPFDQFDTGQQPATPQQPNTWGQAAKNVAQAAGHVTTGAVGGFLGDVAGLGALAYDITANAALHPFSGSEPSQYADPAKVSQRVADFLTYKPSNPKSATMRAVTAPARAFGESGQQINEYVTKKTGNPYLGDIAGAGPLAVANAMGVKAAMPARGNFAGQSYAIPERVPGTPAPPAPEKTPQQAAIENARQAGYKLAPDKADAPGGTTVAKMAGHADLEREMSIGNATITDELAKRSIGLQKDRQLSAGVFKELKDKASRPYGELAKTGKVTADDAYRADIAKITDRTGAASFAEDTPRAVVNLKRIYGNKQAFDAGDAVAKIRQLREDARQNLKAHGDPEKNALGHAQRAVADALDARLARHVEAKGLGDLAKRYQDARVQLAKIHSVEDAFDGGHVSARELYQQKNRGVPLSGELKLVADSYEFFDRVMQEPSKVRARGPLSAIDYFVGLGGAAVDPTLLAASLARPAARAILKSEAYQRSLAPKGKPGQQPAQRPAVDRSKAAPAAPASQQRDRRAG